MKKKNSPKNKQNSLENKQKYWEREKNHTHQRDQKILCQLSYTILFTKFTKRDVSCVGLFDNFSAFVNPFFALCFSLWMQINCKMGSQWVNWMLNIFWWNCIFANHYCGPEIANYCTFSYLLKCCWFFFGNVKRTEKKRNEKKNKRNKTTDIPNYVSRLFISFGIEMAMSARTHTNKSFEA